VSTLVEVAAVLSVVIRASVKIKKRAASALWRLSKPIEGSETVYL